MQTAAANDMLDCQVGLLFWPGLPASQASAYLLHCRKIGVLPGLCFDSPNG